MKNQAWFKNKLTPAKLPVTLAQLTGSTPTDEWGQDTGILICKAVLPLYEYKGGQLTTTQIGWMYQCTIPAQNNAPVLVKVNELNGAVTQFDLVLGSVPMRFSGFRGIWWVKGNNIELSCRADVALRA